jgi:hypothetical protein
MGRQIVNFLEGRYSDVFVFEFLNERGEHLLKRYCPINQPIKQRRNASFVIDVCVVFPLHRSASLSRFNPLQLRAELLLNGHLLGF